jgi:hypothetical protein
MTVLPRPVRELQNTNDTNSSLVSTQATTPTRGLKKYADFECKSERPSKKNKKVKRWYKKNVHFSQQKKLQLAHKKKMMTKAKRQSHAVDNRHINEGYIDVYERYEDEPCQEDGDEEDEDYFRFWDTDLGDSDYYHEIYNEVVVWGWGFWDVI